MNYLLDAEIDSGGYSLGTVPAVLIGVVVLMIITVVIIVINNKKKNK